MPELGFTDSVAAFTGVTTTPGRPTSLFNPFAAIPSMHVAFALMLGLPMAQVARRRWAQGAVVRATRRWSPSWSSPPPTTGGSTRSWAPPSPPSRAVCAHKLFARARPDVWAWTPRHVIRPTTYSHAISFGAISPPPSSARPARVRASYQAQMRSRLIESRLTPNAISLTGFLLCVVAAVLVWQEQFLLGGIAFIVGSVCDTLDGRYSRMSGKGTPFGAFLDSTLDRIEEGIVLAAVAVYFLQAGRRPRGRRRGHRACSPR